MGDHKRTVSVPAAVQLRKWLNFGSTALTSAITVAANLLETQEAKIQGQQAEIERLRAEVERLTAEAEEWDADTERHVARMAGLLHDTANAVHGGPLAGGMWSWHDLPDLASAERALADQLADELRVATEYADWPEQDHLKHARSVIASYEEARRDR